MKESEWSYDTNGDSNNAKTITGMSEQVVILSSSPRSMDGQFLNFENDMYLGGQVRMEAAAELANTHQDTEFILVGGYNKHGDLQISDKVNDMADFIRERSPAVRLRPIRSLPCTHHNFVAIFNTILNETTPDEIGVLTNSYHLPRALEFARRAQDDMGLTKSIGLVAISAEDILNRPIEDIVSGYEDEYQARLDAEEKGLRELKDGIYKDGCLTTYKDVLSGVISKFPDILLSMNERVANMSK